MMAEAANGRFNGWTNGLPIWARAITIIGVPSAIAIFLVWVGANDLPKIHLQVAQNALDIQRNTELLRELKNQNYIIQRSLVRICSNTAKSHDERQKCFDE